jgi:choline-sulfatase
MSDKSSLSGGFGHPSLSRRHLLAGAAAGSLATGGTRPARAAAERPNLVMFMTDDHGAWATGAYGCADMHTPNIDRLAREGVMFTHAYAATPVCSPSRLTYMTGVLPFRHGVQDWLRPVDAYGPRSHRWLEGFHTWPRALADAGYTLGMTGKWHMGEDDKPQEGFTWWCTVPGGGGPYLDQEFVRNGVRAVVKGFKTDVVGDCALEFIDQQKADRPFALYLPFYAPHTPYDYQPDVYRQPFVNSTFPCYPDVPKHQWQNPGYSRMHGKRDPKWAYSALIAGADANIGRVLKRLEERGLRENTIVVFTADQGWNAGHHGVWGKGNGTWPFNMYEESIRVPLIWNYPRGIKPGVVPQLVSAYDFYPTVLEMMGVPAAPDARRVGRSYAPFLRGAQPPPRWRDRLYFEYSNVRAVRTGNLKYVERTQEWPSELFDLETDPGETRSVLNERPYSAQRQALRADLARFFRTAGAPPLAEWRSTTRQELTVYQQETPSGQVPGPGR